jgi:MFS family permease
MMWCNFLAAGPTIAIVRTTLDFFPHADPTTNVSAFNSSIAKVAYFFTATALLQGTSNFFWVPMANKYGRRPVYIISYVFYLACAIWLVFEKSFAGFLAARILLGVASGAAETIGLFDTALKQCWHTC